MIQNHISHNLYSELFLEISKPSTVKISQLLSRHFPPILSLCILYFFLHKGKYTSAIPQPSIHYLLCFPHFLSFS